MPTNNKSTLHFIDGIFLIIIIIIIIIYGRYILDVDWGLVVKLALSEKVTRRAYKIFCLEFMTDFSLKYSSILNFKRPRV
jgi:hypothetical protein